MTDHWGGTRPRTRPQRIFPKLSPVRALLIILPLLAACATNPWREAYIPLEADAQPVEHADLLLVDFDEATRERPEPGMRPMGYASFTGTYTRSIERRLRDLAREKGATLVAWGARHLHTQTRTDLQPVFETYTSRRRGTRYDPLTGRYVEISSTRTTDATRYVPVVRSDAIYAFRAVFYRPDETHSQETPPP